MRWEMGYSVGLGVGPVCDLMDYRLTGLSPVVCGLRPQRESQPKEGERRCEVVL